MLVARNAAERLSSIARELGSAHDIDCDVIVADLVTDEGMAAVEHRLRAESQPVDLLVNSAGFGLPTSFLKSAVDDEEAMLRVFVLAVLRCHTPHSGHGRAWARCGRQRVVGRGFLPAGRTQRRRRGSPCSARDYTLNSVDTGVRVMALCSGYVHTEMHERMGVRASGPSWVWLDAQDVVAVALRDLRRGKAVSVPGLQWKALVTLVDLLPRAALRRPASLRRR